MDDVLMFDVQPEGENKLFIVFDKVASALEKLITTGKIVTAVMDGVKGVSSALSTKYPVAKLATGREGTPDNFIGPVIPKTADSIASPVGPSPMGKFGATAAIAGAVYTGFKKLANVLMGMPELLQQLGDKFNKFVSYISPATSQRFQYAMEDLYATIGEKLLPVFEPLIRFIERFADVLASINTSGLFTALGKLASLIGGVIIKALELLAPVINAVVWVLEKLVDAVTWVVEKLKSSVSGLSIQAARRWIADRFGTTRGAFADGPNASTEGNRARATRGISVMGLEQAQTRALEAAGRIGQRSAADRTADDVAAIRRLAHSAFDSMEAMERAAEMEGAVRPV